MMANRYTLRSHGNRRIRLWQWLSRSALYPLAMLDAVGKPLNGGAGNCTLTFPGGAPPLVDVFWFATMHNGMARWMNENPIFRRMINSRMLPDLKPADGGSLTLEIRRVEPSDPEQEANWHPAPDCQISMAMRLTGPK